jgi:Tol biopolymer transport system component
LTSIDANVFPVWGATDRKGVIFSLWKTGSDSFDIYWMPWDKSGNAESVLIREEDQFPKSVSVSNNGSFLAFDETHPITKWDIHILSLAKDHRIYPFLNSPFDERDPCFSPDGRYLAYCSNDNEKRQEEIYVKAFDISGSETSVIPISTDGGRWPRFSKNGDELFFMDESAIMAVKIELKPEFKRLENPRVLFRGPFSEWYDVTSDGQHFIMMEEEKVELKALNVILNWSEELKQKVPVKK